MSTPPNESLTRREREIMDVLYALGNRASAEEIRERLTDAPSYSAVRTMLVRLETKGFLRHSEEGLRYIYAPVASRASAQRTALGKLVRTFFGGSPSLTAAALLKQENWTDAELNALRAEIDAVRKDRKRS